MRHITTTQISVRLIFIICFIITGFAASLTEEKKINSKSITGEKTGIVYTVSKKLR